MKRKPCMILVIQISILVFVSVCIVFPYLFLGKSSFRYQIILTYIVTNILVYLIYKYTKEPITRISRMLKTALRNLVDSEVSVTSDGEGVPDYEQISDNIHHISSHIEKYLESKNNFFENYCRLNKDLEQKIGIRDRILELSQSIIEIDNLEELFNLILKKAVDFTPGAEKGSILVIGDYGLLEYKSVIGYDLEKLKMVKLRLEDTFLWNMSKGNIKDPCIIRDVEYFNKTHLNEQNYKNLKSFEALNIKTSLSSPIIINNKLYGMLNVDSFDENAFSQEDISLMGYFASQIGIAIRNHKLIEETVYLSRYDSLTNIYNRRYFEELITNYYKKALRYKESFALVAFDLDRFKKINDTYGHLVGDKVIQCFAETLKKNMRESDLFARYGGDEFIAVFFSASKREIEDKLAKIGEEFNELPIEVEDGQIITGFSYGIASCPCDSDNLEELFKIADKRMYVNKLGKKV